MSTVRDGSLLENFFANADRASDKSQLAPWSLVGGWPCLEVVPAALSVCNEGSADLGGSWSAGRAGNGNDCCPEGCRDVDGWGENRDGLNDFGEKAPVRVVHFNLDYN